MGGIWDLGVAANSRTKKITHINFATLIGRVFVCCNDAEKDVIPTWLSAANIDDNSSIFVRCDHLTKAASAVKQDALLDPKQLLDGLFSPFGSVFYSKGQLQL